MAGEHTLGMNDGHNPEGVRPLRLFVALTTNAAMQSALQEAQRALARHAELPVRWVSPAQMHLTLQFLGDVPAARVPVLTDALRRVVTPHRAFLLHSGVVGAFPNARAPRVLWLDVRGDVDALAALQRDVARVVGNVAGVAADRQPFRAHVTLGRVRENRAGAAGAQAAAAALARPIAVPHASWPIADVALIHSVLGAGGPRYTVLERFPLRGGEAADAGGPTI